jgi:hypothetical protein
MQHGYLQQRNLLEISRSKQRERQVVIVSRIQEVELDSFEKSRTTSLQKHLAGEDGVRTSSV